MLLDFDRIFSYPPSLNICDIKTFFEALNHCLEKAFSNIKKAFVRYSRYSKQKNHSFSFLCWVKVCMVVLDSFFFKLEDKILVSVCLRQVVVLYSNSFMVINLGGLNVGCLARVVLQSWSFGADLTVIVFNKRNHQLHKYPFPGDPSQKSLSKIVRFTESYVPNGVR